MAKAYAYIRVSTIDQKMHGWSLEIQWKKAQMYADLLAMRPGLEGLVLAKTFEDGGQSAYKKPLIARKEGSILNGTLENGDHVIFIRMDRAFRNLRDFIQTKHIWDLRNITIHYVDQMIDLSTANGRLAGNIMASVAQWESDIKSERQIEAWARMREKKANGVKIPTGPTAGGFKKIGSRGNKKTVLDIKQIPILKLITKLKNFRKMTWKEISEVVETALAKREKRKVRPMMQWSDSKPKRFWDAGMCQRAYYEFKKYLES